MLESAYIVLFLEDNSVEPTKFLEAYNHPDPDTHGGRPSVKSLKTRRTKEYGK
jgi:hypothetical protein